MQTLSPPESPLCCHAAFAATNISQIGNLRFSVVTVFTSLEMSKIICLFLDRVPAGMFLKWQPFLVWNRLVPVTSSSSLELGTVTQELRQPRPQIGDYDTDLISYICAKGAVPSDAGRLPRRG